MKPKGELLIIMTCILGVIDICAFAGYKNGSVPFLPMIIITIITVLMIFFTIFLRIMCHVKHIKFYEWKDLWQYRVKADAAAKLLKEILPREAFIGLLKGGVDYTIKPGTDKPILAGAKVKWAYCLGDSIEDAEAIFTIKTDKGLYAFQASHGKLMLVPTELVTTLYKFK